MTRVVIQLHVGSTNSVGTISFASVTWLVSWIVGARLVSRNSMVSIIPHQSLVMCFIEVIRSVVMVGKRNVGSRMSNGHTHVVVTRIL